MVLVTCRNPRILRQGDQRALRQLKRKIESSNNKLFFVKHISAGSTQAIIYLVQVDMEQSDPIDMRDYGVYPCRWYIINHKYFTQHRTMECCFWLYIREMKQYGTPGKMILVRPLKVNGFLQRYKIYVWYQDNISLADHSMVGSFKFIKTGRKKLEYPNMIDKRQCKELGKERRKNVINTLDTK